MKLLNKIYSWIVTKKYKNKGIIVRYDKNGIVIIYGATVNYNKKHYLQVELSTYSVSNDEHWLPGSYYIHCRETVILHSAWSVIYMTDMILKDNRLYGAWVFVMPGTNIVDPRTSPQNGVLLLPEYKNTALLYTVEMVFIETLILHCMFSYYKRQE